MPDRTNKIRLIILADMGNEPDEEQQMTHMLVCSDRLELEGLIAVTGKYLRNTPQPERFHNLFDGYDLVLPNLRQHSDGFPETDDLRSITHAGQQSYGMDDVGEGKSSPGSEQIVTALTKDDPRPVYVVINAGSNTLAQAMWDIRSMHSDDDLDALVRKLRVFENGAQDNAGAWICHHFPDIHWIRSNFQTYAFGGPDHEGGYGLGPYTWEPYAYSALGQHHWDLEHVIAGHGSLGTRYPLRLMHKNGRLVYKEGGGTTPWMGLLNPGLYDPDHPWWGGWSGRFSREKVENAWSRHADVRADEASNTPFSVYEEASDSWVDPETRNLWEGVCVPVWRWRRAMFNNQRCRMDWCVKPYDEANHHPTAVLNGDEADRITIVAASQGDRIELDAAGSNDPDGDPLAFKWFIYNEAGTYRGEIDIPDAAAASTALTVPTDAGGSELHVILEVRDKNPIASLYDYRRMVIRVSE